MKHNINHQGHILNHHKIGHNNKVKSAKNNLTLIILVVGIVLISIFLVYFLVKTYNNSTKDNDPIIVPNPPTTPSEPSTPNTPEPTTPTTPTTTEPTSPSTPTTPSTPVQDSPYERTFYNDITLINAKKLYDENKELIVIDFSASAVYKISRIKNSVNYPADDGSLDNIIPTLDKTKTYLVYARQEATSLTGTKKMMDAGFKNVNRLKGNYGIWITEGYPIEKG
ncbi:MAG: rhodanese-like domain-containing protein [Candidatus Pacearchaeota archaeon]|jgi:rhodanese-related sulfurtransferase